MPFCKVVPTDEGTLWEEHHKFDLSTLWLSGPWTIKIGYVNYRVEYMYQRYIFGIITQKMMISNWIRMQNRKRRELRIEP